jgi:diadenosine tetraphosphatase ApaH/serine/threonine PP2A family protein phosphatase
LRIALLSDIHANVEALTACLKHAAEHGAEGHVFLGDLVGYGADPVGVLEIVAAHARAGAVVLQGNHDQAVAASSSYFNEAGRAAIERAPARLGEEHKRLLAGLPLLWREGSECHVHASAASPERWTYVDSPSAAKSCVEAAQATYTFCGHVHDQLLYFENPHGRMGEFRPSPGTPIPVPSHRRWLAVVGSVGQPRDRNPAAAYALFDRRLEQLTFYRVAYDARAAADSIRRSGLPESLAFRVELGV